MDGGANPKWLVSLQEEEEAPGMHTHAHMHTRMCTRTHTHIHRRKAMWGQSKSGAICQPKKKVQEKPHLPTPWSWTSSLQNWEKRNLHCLTTHSWITQSCPTLCDPMNHSTPGLPVHHRLPEFTQAHVHWVSDAIQPSPPLSSPSPPALNLSQHQGLFQWVSSLHQVAKVLEFQL